MNGQAFIAGCQRSGTTLLRFMLEAHPRVTVVDEAAAYPVLAGRRTLQQAVGAVPDGDLVVCKIPRFAEQLLESGVVDEAYGAVPQFYTGEPVVWIVRDPRDVVASMCALEDARGVRWIEQHGRAMVDDRLRRRAGFAAAYARELDALQQGGWPAHLLGALYWRVKNDCLERYLTAGLPVLVVRYEALVADPASAARAITVHLGLGWDDAVLAHHTVAHGQLEAGGRAIGASDPARAVDRASVGRYRRDLTAAQAEQVMAWATPAWRVVQRVAPA